MDEPVDDAEGVFMSCTAGQRHGRHVHVCSSEAITVCMVGWGADSVENERSNIQSF